MICSTCQRESGIGLPCNCGQTHCPRCFDEHVCLVEPPPLWEHQRRALDEFWQAVETGEKAICITSPTGGGKTRLMAEITLRAVSQGLKGVVYSNRKLLTNQISRMLRAHGIDHGMMAADHDPALLRDVQVASVQTIGSRVLKSERWDIHAADFVLVDEAHVNKATTVQAILDLHREMGAVCVGFTATPVGIGRLWKKLIVAGTNSDLRACGALVPCRTFAPDEPDLTKMIRQANGEYSEEAVVKRIMAADGETKLPRIFGRVLEHWRRLNPDQKPTLLFAPSVPASRWFAEWLTAQGVPSVHIDGETPDDERHQFLAESLEGAIKVLCNRFVLREGIDMPWLAHGIFATSYGAIHTYLQAGGRLLRAYPGLEEVLIQDHGGNWWQPGFGSLNDDRQWDLSDSANSLHKKAKKEREAGEGEPEALCCPRCGALNRASRILAELGCPVCGHQFKRSKRVVIQTDGTLKAQYGRAIKRKRQVPADEKIATGLFIMAMKSGRKPGKKPMTVHQLNGAHRGQTGQPFPDGLVKYGGQVIYLPNRDTKDWYQPVRDFFGGAA